MPSMPPSPELRRRAIRLWLLAVAACVFATLVIGGATRLTESGLSIVEWKPVWMVASGLDHRVDVSQYRLALHLTLACVLYAAIVWTAARLSPDPPAETPPRLRASAVAVLVLVLAQIYLGALVAGLDAGLTYNAWPLIDGRLVPGAAELFPGEPLWRNYQATAILVLTLAVMHAARTAAMRSPAMTAPVAV